jgi:hypothetical protein
VDQASADMQTETQEPQNQKNNEKGPKHVNLLIIGPGLIRFADSGRADSRLRSHNSADDLRRMLMFPSACAALLLAAVTDHGQIRDRHMTVLGGVFIHIVLFHLRLRVFLHPVGCGI